MPGSFVKRLFPSADEDSFLNKSFGFKQLWKFTAFAAFMILLIFTVEHINGRFWLNDFKVYYMAAKALLGGEQVYGIPFGESSGLYKYSPFVLFAVFPYMPFSFETAAVFHFFVLGLVIVSVFYVTWDIFSRHLLRETPKNLNLLISLAFVCVLIHFVKELHLGNINVVLLLLCCLSLRALLNSKNVLSGILFGLVVLTKPFFLILILPLLFRKKWSALAGLGGTLLAGFLIPSVFFGFSKTVFLYKEWIYNIFAHNATYPGHNSMQYLLHYYINPGIPNEFQYVIIAGGGLLFLIMHYFNRKYEIRNENSAQSQGAGLIMEWFVLVAVLPNLVKTDSEHFLCSLPLIMLIIFYLASKRQIMPIILFIILIFFYGANSNDVLGSELSDRLFNMGLIGISNMFIIAMSLAIFYSSPIFRERQR